MAKKASKKVTKKAEPAEGAAPDVGTEAVPSSATPDIEPASSAPERKIISKPAGIAGLSGNIPTAPSRNRNPADRPVPQYQFRRERKPSVNPRRVRGGVKLKAKEGEEPESWVTQRMNRIVEAAATGSTLREGLEYARMGQTKKLEVGTGRITASIQGRGDRPYRTTLAIEPFTDKRWAQMIESMADQALYAAKLLAGELPPNIEDLFAPLGLRLFPTEPGEFGVTCSCSDPGKDDNPWCKHAVCAAALAAERLGEDPFLIFTLRGIMGEELIERLRERRAMAGQGPGATPVYSAHVPGVSDANPTPLEAAVVESVDRFWKAGPELSGIELPLARPEVSHVLLRRLGPSPFTEARFPLVGLLATCYELIGEDALKAADGNGQDGDETDPRSDA